MRTIIDRHFPTVGSQIGSNANAFYVWGDTRRRLSERESCSPSKDPLFCRSRVDTEGEKHTYCTEGLVPYKDQCYPLLSNLEPARQNTLFDINKARSECDPNTLHCECIVELTDSERTSAAERLLPSWVHGFPPSFLPEAALIAASITGSRICRCRETHIAEKGGRGGCLPLTGMHVFTTLSSVRICSYQTACIGLMDI